MTMDTDSLALRIARVARLDPHDATAAIDAIVARGHQFVAPGTPGTLESEEAFRNLARYLRTEAALSFAKAFGVFDALARLGFKITSTAAPTELE